MIWGAEGDQLNEGVGGPPSGVTIHGVDPAASGSEAEAAARLHLGLDPAAPGVEGAAAQVVLKGLCDEDMLQALQECDDLLRRKGADYTQGREGEFGTLQSFYDSAKDADMSPFKVLYVLLNKHMAAIRTFLKMGHVESEPIEGRIVDAINYLFLLYKMVQVEKRKAAGRAALSQR